MEQKKVLILYLPLGAGHGSTAEAIAEAFAKNHPDIEVRNINILDFAFDVFKKGLPKAYTLISSRAPVLYKWIYKYHKRHSRQDFLNKISDAILKGSKFVNFLNDFNPNFIISTNPLPMHLVSETKQKHIISTPSANVCTDFGFHSFWYNKDVNYYFVATEQIKKRLLNKKVKKNSIIITGIPVKDKFLKNQSRKKITAELGLNSLNPVLLVVGGKMNYNNLIAVFYGIRKKNKNAQFIMVAGRDEKLLERLKDSELSKDPMVKIFGFIDNLDELMTAADLILTKAGGITVAECLTKGLPMIVNDVIPGQEEDNVKYIIANKAGFKAKSEEKCVKLITELFSNPEKIAKLKTACKKIAQPNAAEDVADFVVSKLKLKSNKHV